MKQYEAVKAAKQLIDHLVPFMGSENWLNCFILHTNSIEFFPLKAAQVCEEWSSLHADGNERWQNQRMALLR